MQRASSPAKVGIGIESPSTPRKLHLDSADLQTPCAWAKEPQLVSDVSTACPSSSGLQDPSFGSEPAHQYSGFGRLDTEPLDFDNLGAPGDFGDVMALFTSGLHNETIAPADGAAAPSPSMPLSPGEEASFDARGSGDSNAALAEEDPQPHSIYEAKSSDESERLDEEEFQMLGGSSPDLDEEDFQMHFDEEELQRLRRMNPDFDEEEIQTLAEFNMFLEARAPVRDCPECLGRGRDRIGLTCFSCRGRGQARVELPPCVFPEDDVTEDEPRKCEHVVAMAAHLSILSRAIASYAGKPEAFPMPFTVVYPGANFAQDFHHDDLPDVMVQPADQMKVFEAMSLTGQAGEEARARVAQLLRWNLPDSYSE